MSTKEFYQAVSRRIKEMQYPVSIHTQEFGEDGWLSPRREYLRIVRGELEYYVCAAPFGRSFFISWWLRQPPTPILEQVHARAIRQGPKLLGELRALLRDGVDG